MSESASNGKVQTFKKVVEEIQKESKRGTIDFFLDTKEQLSRMHLEHKQLFNQIIHLFTFPLGEFGLALILLSFLSPSTLSIIIAIKLLYCSYVDIITFIPYCVCEVWGLWIAINEEIWDCKVGLIFYLLPGLLQFIVGHRVMEGNFPRAVFGRRDLTARVYPLYEIVFGPFLFFSLVIMQLGVHSSRYVKIRERTRYLQSQRSILKNNN